MERVEPKRILVVDDEKEVLDYLSSTLRRSGFEVISTTKGKEAVRLARELFPDLVLLDIVIPDMMGDDVAFALSEDSATAGIPIIFLTGILTKKEELNVGKSGRHFVMAKPVDSQKLLKMIQRVFS